MIERNIITGLIVSTDFCRQIRSQWDYRLMESPTARMIARWCWQHFEKYDTAPGADIENIFHDKLREGTLKKEAADEIENILFDLSGEYHPETFNLSYVLDATINYLRLRGLSLHSEKIMRLIENNDVNTAEEVALNFQPVTNISKEDVDLSTDQLFVRIDRAFDNTAECLIEYPKQMGAFWNDQLVRGALVCLLGSEKRGKTWRLIEMALRGARQKRKVAFFEAGDMSEGQLIRRFAIHLARRSDKKRYTAEHYQSCRDCIWNQLNTCTKKERECDFGIFEGENDYDVRNKKTFGELEKAFLDYPDYAACHNCAEYEYSHWGTPWLKLIPEKEPLTKESAKEVAGRFFANRPFKLSVHPNDTLTVSMIEARLQRWEKEDNFIPDIIVIDYADILLPEVKDDSRHQHNHTWKGLRRLSQQYDALVLTATQADAKSYDADRLKASNFSEDKRKHAHVTAEYGLNQDTKGREKRLGLMRINKIVVREEDFDTRDEIIVIQDLWQGQPFLGSFF